jgi:hypothetical protein
MNRRKSLRERQSEAVAKARMKYQARQDARGNALAAYEQRDFLNVLRELSYEADFDEDQGGFMLAYNASQAYGALYDLAAKFADAVERNADRAELEKIAKDYRREGAYRFLKKETQ